MLSRIATIPLKPLSPQEVKEKYILSMLIEGTFFGTQNDVLIR
jgi:hypothetical protein